MRASATWIIFHSNPVNGVNFRPTAVRNPLRSSARLRGQPRWRRAAWRQGIVRYARGPARNKLGKVQAFYCPDSSQRPPDVRTSSSWILHRSPTEGDNPGLAAVRGSLRRTWQPPTWSIS